MTREEHLLTCLAEECAEVVQRVSKALRFGMNEVQPGQDFSNRQRIAEELGDLYAVALILADEGILPLINAPLSAKRAKIEVSWKSRANKASSLMDKDELYARLMSYSAHIERMCGESTKPAVVFGRATMRDVAECIKEAAAALRSHAQPK